MRKRIIFIILPLIISSIANADVTVVGKIKNIEIDGQSIVSVWLDTTANTTECSGGWRWTVANTDALFKEKLSTLLAAAAAGRTVTLFHLSGWGCGNWNSNKIYYVNVQYN